MSRQSPFVDEWRACMREQYKSVIRQQDHTTERTLTGVMFECGFSEAELAELRVLATMRADEMPDDYVPDVVYQSAGVDLPPEPEAEAVDDTSETEPDRDEIEAAAADDDIQPEAVDEDEEEAEDGPQQMSLF